MSCSQFLCQKLPTNDPIETRSRYLNCRSDATPVAFDLRKNATTSFIVYDSRDQPFKTRSILVRPHLPPYIYMMHNAPCPILDAQEHLIYLRNGILAFLMTLISLTVVTPIYKP
jgi:hypothetical protein